MKPGRNDPCPCGSGKKYKKCCQQKSEVYPPASDYPTKEATPTPAEYDQLIALFNAGHHAELENRARLLLERYPDSGFAWKLLSATLQMQGKGSLYALQKASELLPDDAEVHNNLGLIFQELGQLNEAEASYRRALQAKPDYTAAHYNLGNTLTGLGRLNEAEASYRRVLQIKPDDADAHYNLGNALRELGRLNEAEASYRRALQIKPDFANVYNNLGNTLQALDRPDEAETSYRRALQIKPDFVEAYSNLGNTLKNMGRLDEAEASYRRALQIKPDSAKMHSNLGLIFQDMGRLDEAEASYQRAIRIKPDDAVTHYNLGIIFQELGRLDEAETSYQRAIQIKPDYAAAHNNLGFIFQELGRIGEAEASYRRAFQIKPDYAEARYNLGNVLKEQVKLEDAAACYRYCLEIDPKDHLGARLLLAALGLEPMPLRASEAHLEAFYIKRAGAWDQALGRTQTYRGAELVAQALKSLSNKAGKLDILDAGCGTGHVGLMVRDLASRLDGVDMAPGMLEKAREKKIYDNIYQGDLELFMKDHPDDYDAITCAATLIHFGDLSPVFSAAAACLRNDGLFVFTVFPNEHEQESKEVVVAHIDGLARSGCYAHSKSYVIRMAETAGFIVEMFNTDIHEYYKDIPIMCFVVALRRRPRLAGLN